MTGLGRPRFCQPDPVPARKPINRPFDPSAPFRRAEALAAGLTDADLAGPAYRQLLWGVHITASVEPTLPVRALAALTVSPRGTLITHHTAAELWGGIVPPTPCVHVGVRRKARLLATGVTAHRYAVLPPSQRQRGLPVTSPEQTFTDLSSALDLVELVVLGDSLVRKGVTTADDLRTAAAKHRGRGARVARRAAALVRAGVDSPMETRLRLLIVLAGLPEPVVDYRVRDEEGRVVYRIDLSYPELKVAIEYDGRQHIERESQWSSDILRREDLENDGWRFVVAVSQDVYATPEATLRRVVTALESRGAKARLRRDEWRRFFPGHSA